MDGYGGKRLMNLKRLSILLVFILCLIPAVGGATTYTVCSGGCDETAIQDVFDNNDLGANDIVEVRADSPGGTVHFREEVTWGANDSGTSGNPVILRGRSGDTVIINGASDVTTSGWADQGGDVWRHAIGATEPLIVTFNGSTVGTVDATPDAQYEWTYSNPNLDVYATDDPDNEVYYTQIEAAQQDRGVHLNGAISYVIVEDLTLKHQNADGVGIWDGPSNIIVQDCDIGPGGHFGVISHESSDITIRRNKIHDMQLEEGVYIDAEDDADETSNIIVTENEIYDNLENGVVLRSTFADRIQNVTVSYNYIYDNGYAGDGNGFQSTKAKTIDIVGNVIVNPAHGISCVKLGTSTIIVNIYTNTLINNAEDNHYTIDIEGTTATIDVKNNILYVVDDPLVRVTTGAANVTLDYNLYYKTNTNYTNDWHWLGTDYSTLAAWVSASSQDSNSPAVANPLFTNAGADDFTLKPNSLCRNRAVYISGYTTKLRPESTWPSGVVTMEDILSIGAYGVYRGSALMGF